MRRKRNDAFYDIALVTDTEAEEAVSAADDFSVSFPRTANHELGVASMF
jgi:hypothetical protein